MNVQNTLLKSTIVGALALLTLTASACTDDQAKHSVTDQAVEDLKVLSADDMGGREAGTEGNAKARAYIINRLVQMGVLAMNISYEVPFEYKPRRAAADAPMQNGVNIIAKIKGKNPSKAMAVTAHYDHVGTQGEDIYNGADDNASGVAGALAIAECFMENPPENDVIIIFFDAEEKGLKGAFSYVEGMENIKSKIAFNMNMDMISRDINNELWMSGLYHFPELVPLAEKLIPMASVELKLGKDIPGTGSADWTFASDHGPFIAADVPAIYFGVDFHPDYHKPTDTFENVTMDYFKRAIDTVILSAEFLDDNLAEIVELSEAADAAAAE